MTDPERTAEEASAAAAWYDALPDDFKNYVAFRAERAGDPEALVLHEAIKGAAKLSKEAKRQRRQA